LSLVEESNLLTWHSVARYTAVLASRARLEANQGGSVEASAVSYLKLVNNLERLPNPLDRDARPILDAVQMLRNRGDQRAAVLLLTAAAHAGPPNAAVRREFERMAPQTLTSSTRWMGAMISAAGLVTVLLGHGLVGMAFGFVAVMGWMRWIPIRGWTRSETRIFRILHAMQYDPVTRGPALRARDYGDRRLFWGFVGLAVGGLVVGPVVMSSLPTAWSPNLGNSPWLLATLVCGILGYQWGLRVTPGARSPRAVSRILPPHCQCATTTIFAGGEADNYAHNHLVGEAHEAGPSRSSMLTCPVLGVAWLLTIVTDEGGAYLLRGEAQIADADPLPHRQSAPDAPERRRAEAHTSMGADVFAARERLDHGSVRVALAGGASSPEHLLVELSKDPEKAVRAAVAGNPNCPETVLLELFADPEMDVWTAAKNNLRWPEDWPVDDPCAARGIDPPRDPHTLRSVVCGTQTLVRCTAGRSTLPTQPELSPDSTAECRADAVVVGIWGSFCMEHHAAWDRTRLHSRGGGYLAQRLKSGTWVELNWDGPCSPPEHLWR